MAVLETRARGMRTSNGISRAVRSSQPEKGVAQVVAGLLGADLPVALRAYDGSRVGPDPAPATIVLRSPDALRRIVTAPGELGLSRAYVSGDLDLEGDTSPCSSCATTSRGSTSGWRQVLELLRVVGLHGLRPLPAAGRGGPPRGRLHSRQRDAGGHLAPLRRRQRVLRAAARPVHDLLVRGVDRRRCRRRRARRGPVRQVRADLPQARRSSRACGCSTSGCGWGGMVRHAARHHGVRAVGITMSTEQAALGPRARSSARGWPTGSRSGCRTTATSRDGPVRRHQLDRHVRARRAGPACAATCTSSTGCWSPRVAC